MERINLLPAKKREKKEVLPKINLVMVVILLAGILIISVIHIWQKGKIDNLAVILEAERKKMLSLNERRDELQKAQSQLEIQLKESQKRRDRIKNLLAFLQREQESRINWASVLVELAKLIPAKLWVDRLFFDEGLLQIQGVASHNLAISDLLSNLDNSPYFNNPNFSFLRKDKIEDKEVTRFKVSVSINNSNEINRDR